MEWEKKYAKWIQTSAVHTSMFTSKKSKYYGVRADGADALRAIFKGYGFFQTTIRDDLNYMCIINYRRGVRINLHHIYDRLSKVLMTLHSNDGKFMNYEDYDAYSTPSRDRPLEMSFERLYKDYKYV